MRNINIGCPLMWCTWEGHKITLLVFSWQKALTWIYSRGKRRQTRVDGTLYKHWPVLFKSVKVMKSQTQKGGIVRKYNVWCWIGSWFRKKDISQIITEIWIRIIVFTNVNFLVLIMIIIVMQNVNIKEDEILVLFL